MSDFMVTLPSRGSGYWFNGGPGSTGSLSSSVEVYNWLGQTVLPAIFQARKRFAAC